MNRLMQSEVNQSLLLAMMAFAIASASWGVLTGSAPLLKQELAVMKAASGTDVLSYILVSGFGLVWIKPYLATACSPPASILPLSRFLGESFTQQPPAFLPLPLPDINATES